MTTPTSNPREYRNTLSRFATGVTVVTALDNGQPHGMTANAFVSVSLDPPLLLVSLANRCHMNHILSAGGIYGINVLAEDQRTLSDHFAGRKVEGVQVRFISRAGAMLLEGAIAYFVVRVKNVHLTGDHTLYVGSVEYYEQREDRPLLFYGGKYEQLEVER